MPSLPREVGGYTVGRKVGSGSFGEVYEGRRGSHRVAIKLEPREEEAAKKSGSLKLRTPHLRKEWKYYRSLKGSPGIPKAYYYGSAGKHYKGLVLELLGDSLEDLFKKHHKIFSLKSTLMLADQMIERLRELHERGIIHCDVKPNNFLVGRGKNAGKIYLVDFGLSRRYLDSETGQHIAYRDGKTSGLTGTARYSSVRNHQGVELARRDDLEGLAYVLVRMLKGTLPWQGCKAETKPLRNELIKQCKITTSADDLCENIPKEFAELIQRCRDLPFDVLPPYEELQGLMRKALADANLKNDRLFDWTKHSKTREDSSTSTAASSRRRESRSRDRSDGKVRSAMRCDRSKGQAQSEDSKVNGLGLRKRRNSSISKCGRGRSKRLRSQAS